ncbi:putative 1-phosphatidylinositol 3-phosphate 5-kinase isoform X2 [Planococcus citri]|uniref:putative 1-phosphatidylinositol 3-phosphate 5-kinase isoform X2 n=1 Tax=Planococcus citri TaxID=170843 RepID=UPI0031F79A5A
MTNLDSKTQLTEFAPLSPEIKQSGVSTIFSKFFKFSQDTSSQSEDRSKSNSPSFYVSIEKDNSSGDSEWTNLSPNEAENIPLPSSMPGDRFRPQDSAYEARNLPNVLRRVSNLLALKNKNSPAYKDTNLKQYWMPDSVSKECYDCGEKFTTFRRRHHCRVCGQIFCSQCCNQEVPGKIIRCSGNLRVCTYCCKVVLSYLQSADIEADLSIDLKALQDDLQSKFGLDHSVSCDDDHSLDTLSVTSNSSDVRRKISVVYQEEKFASGGISGNSNRNDPESSRKSELSTLNTLLQELVLGDSALITRNYTVEGGICEGCFWGSQLIDWLINQRKTSSRTHSLAICQVLLDANYIENVGQKSADFIDGGALYKFSESAAALMEKPREDLGHEQSSSIPKNGKKSTFFTGIDVDESIKSFMQKYLEISSLNPIPWASVNESQLSETNNELNAFLHLNESFQQHLLNTVHQLLAAENLSLSWSKIIIDLVEKALREIKIDLYKTDIINIGHYIKVKKISGGERKDSCLVAGIVCTKNVAHKEMNINLINPRILLLQCPIVYQRVEGRLMSLEPVMMQEQQYLRHTVARIAALKPDLVLVHRNVSRLAQESLNALNITLVLNVKMQVMERVARCTNADILTAIDAHVGTTQLGTCRSFYIREMPLKNGGSKTLMFFEGCAFPQLGCTILLRGASESELKKLKTVANDTVFMYYNAKLEKSFLLDEFAEPPTLPSLTFIEEIVSPKHGSSKFNQSFDLSRRTPVEEINLPESKPESAKSERKFDLEEKRISAKSVVDHDDPLHFNSNIDDDDVFSPNQDSSDLSFKEEPQQQNKFRMALRDTVLSYSPYIVFNLPYLETKTGMNCELRKYFPDEIYQSAHFNNKRDGNRAILNENTASSKTNVELFDKKPAHELVHAKLKDDVDSEEVQTMLAFYRAKGGRYSLKKKSTTSTSVPPRSSNVVKPVNNDFLDPRNHQRLPVLFCSFSNLSNNAPEFCVHPWIVNMDFYGCNDIPLGNFLEKYCFRKSYICPSETCDTSMIDHERRFVHDTGCVHIVLRELNSLPEKKLPILVWSSCTICKLTTPISAMSSDTWSLSFAKYLELRFHAGKYTSRVDGACEHSLHHDYCQYFYYKNIIATFKYTDIPLWELSLPPKILKIHPTRVPIPVVMEQVKEWAVMGHELFSSILEKLCLLDYDDIKMIQSLKKHLSDQQAIFKQKVDDIQVILTSPSLDDDLDDENIQKDHKLEDSVVLMKKLVAEALSRWNSLLARLESQKKDNRQKTKSTSSDVKDNIPSSLNSSVIEDSSSKRDSKDESILSEDSDIQDLGHPVPYRSDNSECKPSANRSAVDIYDGPLNQSVNVSSSNETLSNISQNQTPDKITMKTLLSQLLPNTFQNNPSLLSNPINTDEHYLLNVTCTIPIVVYETEPSSIIACALATFQYQNLLDEINKSTSVGTEQSNKISKKESSDGISTSSASETVQMTESDDSIKLDATDDSKSKSAKTNDAYHIEIQFNDSTASFNVKVYFAQQFKDLRSLVFPSGEEAYIRSLSRCIHWNAHGGKSGSMFCKTKDDRFILKEMGRLEIQPFIEFAPHYFNFIQTCYSNHQPTLLGKIVGVYRVKYKNNISNLLVMENLFYTRDIIRKFDLKGSVRNRLVDTQTCAEGELVLLDENLINMTCESPLYVYPHSKTVLMQAINNDVTFLANQSVMDYSLLVGLDEGSQELVVGIIDYIRTFTWDKKLETFVKKSGILGGQGKLPTIVSPEKYKSRFITAMHKYFFAVPDQWLGLGRGFDY